MVARVIRGEALVNTPPDGMLAYDKNCVAMALSRVLGIGVYATVNLCVAKGWASVPASTQYDETILAIMAGLRLTEVAKDMEWRDLRARLPNLADGRYFACNSKADVMGGKGTGHAFAIMKKGGWGIYANNSELNQDRSTYASKIVDEHHVSLWGPTVF